MRDIFSAAFSGFPNFSPLLSCQKQDTGIRELPSTAQNGNDLGSLQERAKWLQAELDRTNARIHAISERRSTNHSSDDVEMTEAPTAGKPIVRENLSGRVQVSDLLNRDTDIPGPLSSPPEEIFSPIQSPPQVVARRSFPTAPVSRLSISETKGKNGMRVVENATPYRRPQTWASPNNYPKSGSGDGSFKEYKEQCPRCPSSFRLPCQLR